MKYFSKLLFIFFIFITITLVAAVPSKKETICLNAIYQLENKITIELKKSFSHYYVVKKHPSPHGHKLVNAEYIRDTWIGKNDIKPMCRIVVFDKKNINKIPFNDYVVSTNYITYNNIKIGFAIASTDIKLKEFIKNIVDNFKFNNLELPLD